MLRRLRARVHSRRKGEAPKPLADIGPQAKQQRLVLARQPLQHLERRRRVRPRLGVRHRNLAAVGERGFQAGSGLAVDHGDFMAGLAEEPRGRDPDHAGTEYQDFHRKLLEDSSAPLRCPWNLRDSAAAAALLLR
jgi:hypothetical protein